MILDEELVVISKIKKHVKDAYQSIAQTMMSGGVDNMEKYRYLICLLYTSDAADE